MKVIIGIVALTCVLGVVAIVGVQMVLAQQSHQAQCNRLSMEYQAKLQARRFVAPDAYERERRDNGC